MGQNKEPKINPHLNSKLGSSTRVPRLYNMERIVSSINGVGEIRYTHTKE